MTEYIGRWGRIRRRLARWLMHFEADPPLGGINPDRQFTIDDGVDYSQPLVIPLGATPEQRQALVTQAITEASAAYHFQFDRPYIYSQNLSLFPTASPLVEWDAQTRKEIIARCHLAWERNPLAKTAVGMTTLFTVGEGMTVTYKNKDVEEILEEFRTNPENGVEEYEKQLCDALQVDGEIFVRFHDDVENGQTVITVIPPWEIDGIKTERGFSRRVAMYHRTGSQSDGTPGDYESIDENIPAAEVLHASINKLAYEMRGRPELFAVLPWLKAYKDWLENRARQNHWRGSLLWDVTLAGATASQVAAKRGQYKQPPPPGSLVVHNDKEVWQPIESKAGAADVAEDGKQIKVMAAVGVKLPLYMLSEGEDANKATATAQQLPALKKFEDFQDILVGQVWKPIYKRVIENAIASGRLREEVIEQDTDGDVLRDEKADAVPDPETGEMPKGKVRKIKAVDAFEVSAPQLMEQDPKNIAEALSIAAAQDWISDETAISELGYDPRLEQKKREREKVARQQAVMQGRGTMPAPQAGQPQQPISGRQVSAQLVPNQPRQPQPQVEAESEDDMRLLRMPPDLLVKVKEEFDRQDAEDRQRLALESNVAQQRGELAEVLRAIHDYTVTREADGQPTIVVNVPEQPAPVVNVQIPPEAIRVVFPRYSERMTVRRDAEDRIVSVEKSIVED